LDASWVQVVGETVYSLQLATLTGSVDDGYTLKLNVPV